MWSAAHRRRTIRMTSVALRHAVTFTLALALLVATTPLVAADPLGDVQRWAGCADWLAEEALRTVAAYQEYATTFKLVKCKLKYRATAISITSNAELTVTSAAGVVVPNYAEGVVGGTGTAADPFIIGGFELDGSVVSCPAISISGTSAHIRVTGNWIHGTGCQTGAIRIANAQNVVVDSNTLSAVRDGIAVLSSSRVHIRSNLIEGAYAIVEPTTGLTVPIDADTPGHGIYVNDVVDTDIEWNHVRPAWQGIFLSGVRDMLVNANTVEGSSVTAIQVYGARGGWNFIQSNTIRGTVWGIGFQDCGPGGWAFIGYNHLRQYSMDPILVNACSATVQDNDLW